MTNIEHLKVVYDEKQTAYNKLCDAYCSAMAAANEIHDMCEAALVEMHLAGEELIAALKDE